MTPTPESRKCSAKSGRSGKPCQKYAIKGGFVCTVHGGRAPQVKAKAEQRIKDMLADAIDPNRVLREVGRLAYSDIGDMFDENGKLLPVKKLPEDIRRAIKSIEVVRGNVDAGDGKFDDLVKVQLHPKGDKLQDLMKHHGQLNEKVDVTITGLEERIKAAQARVNGD